MTDSRDTRLAKVRERAERRERIVIALAAGRMAASEFPWLSFDEEQIRRGLVPVADRIIDALDAARAAEEAQA